MKQFCSIVIVILLICSILCVVNVNLFAYAESSNIVFGDEEQIECKFGDINGDEDFNTSDLADLKLALVGNKIFNERQILAADVNVDGDIDTSDFSLVKIILVQYGYGFNGNFVWPVADHYYIAATFIGDDSVHPSKHSGIDIAGGGISGKPIRAAADGYVYKATNNCTHNYGKKESCGCGSGHGNYVVISHGIKGSNGMAYQTLYAHMSSTAVSNGAYVKKGQVIGYVGSTGWSTGPHLHYEIIQNGEPKDPLSFSFDK